MRLESFEIRVEFYNSVLSICPSLSVLYTSLRVVTTAPVDGVVTLTLVSSAVGEGSRLFVKVSHVSHLLREVVLETNYFLYSTTGPPERVHHTTYTSLGQLTYSSLSI